MSLVVLFFAFIGASVALPYEYQDAENHNVIAVPPNCPPGQQLVNGQCRDIWRINRNSEDLAIIDALQWNRNRNVVTVPTNCPPGQELINGVCRDVWRHLVPTTPLPKQDSEQRDRRQTDAEINVVDLFEVPDAINRNIINIPNQCPIGFKPDALGICREILRISNQLTP